jgi:hypothetical protein
MKKDEKRRTIREDTGIFQEGNAQREYGTGVWKRIPIVGSSDS